MHISTGYDRTPDEDGRKIKIKGNSDRKKGGEKGDRRRVLFQLNRRANLIPPMKQITSRILLHLFAAPDVVAKILDDGGGVGGLYALVVMGDEDGGGGFDDDDTLLALWVNFPLALCYIVVFP